MRAVFQLPCRQGRIAAISGLFVTRYKTVAASRLEPTRNRSRRSGCACSLSRTFAGSDIINSANRQTDAAATWPLKSFGPGQIALHECQRHSAKLRGSCQRLGRKVAKGPPRPACCCHRLARFSPSTTLPAERMMVGMKGCLISSACDWRVAAEGTLKLETFRVADQLAPTLSPRPRRAIHEDFG